MDDIERIGNYQVHPVASLFPLMDDEAFQGLKHSINRFGQQVPIVIQGNVLLDGRNRLLACLELKKDPKVEEYSGKLVPGEYIWQLNYERRDLTDEQRIDISLAASPLIEEEARQRQREAGKDGGKLGGRPKKTLVTDRSQGFVLEMEDPQAKKKRAPPTRKVVAERAGVSERKVQQYLNVERDAPELLDDVKKGKVRLPKAAKVAAERRSARKPRKPRKFNFDRHLKSTITHVRRRIAACPASDRKPFYRELMEELSDMEVINAGTDQVSTDDSHYSKHGGSQARDQVSR